MQGEIPKVLVPVGKVPRKIVMWTCGGCGTYVLRAARICPKCLREFEFREL